ncbi:SIMPL domain-containing protein [Salinarimonas chemoclinalis]|uniref:SIMPL domain-containing protein n=1 Tax=Salinarimonas chemoclinalis TaxID=3241599 RepID=UPI003557CA48
MPIRPPSRLAARLAPLALAAALASPLASGTPPAAAQEVPAAVGRISVTGTGEVERAPDFARVFVSVTNRGDSVAAVVEANRAATEDALAAIEARGVAREDVQTANFQVFETPEEYDRNGDPRPVEPFTATHRLTIVLRDTDAVGAFAGEILALDAITFQAIAWGLERSEEAQDEAMRRAVADARRQAQVLAEAAGVTLGPIRRIGDGHVGGGPQPEMDRMMMRASAAPAVPIVPPARLVFGAQVGMEWAIGE